MPDAHGGGGRIVGIDAARALAVLGMLMVHVGPTSEPGVGGTLYGLVHGRAAILFGLLAGVGVSLLARSGGITRSQTRLRLAWRTLVLLAAGLALQELDHGVFVILQDYALLFVLGILALSLPDRWVLGLAGVSWLGGSLGYLWGQIHRADAFVREAAAWGQPTGEMLHRLVLSGPYPLITWAAPFLVGMWLGRTDLRAPGRSRDLTLVGAVLAIGAATLSRGLEEVTGATADPATWAGLVLDDPHSQRPLWLLGATGSALLVLGAMLWLLREQTVLSRPLVAVGQLAFTVYVGHLLALDAAPEALTSDEVGEAAVIVAGMSVAAFVLATLWRRHVARGPLEALLHLPTLVRPTRGGVRPPA